MRIDLKVTAKIRTDDGGIVEAPVDLIFGNHLLTISVPTVWPDDQYTPSLEGFERRYMLTEAL